MKYRLALIFLILLAYGCNFEPRRMMPYVCMPETWRIEADESSTLANVRWWESLGDPILNELIVAGLDNNNDLKIASWRVFEYLAKYQIVRSELFPQVNLQSSAIRERFPVSSFIPFNLNPIQSDFKYAFTLSYEIDIWGRIRSATHAAMAQVLASIENRKTVVLTLVSSIAQTYVSLRELDRELEIINTTITTREESLRIAKLRFEGGVTSEIDVAQAAAALDDALSRKPPLVTQIAEYENLLSILIGENPTCILRGKAVDQFELPNEIPAGLPSEILCQRPDIISAEEDIVSANALIGVARANFFPQISLTGLYGGESFELSQLFSNSAKTWQLGGTLLQPLFTGFRLTGQLLEAEVEREEAIYNYQQVILTAFKEVNDALVAHREAKKEVVIEADRVANMKEYLKLSWLRYYEGQTQYLTVLDAERQLLEAQLKQAEAQSNLFVTLIDIYKALGGGWVVDADSCLRDN